MAIFLTRLDPTGADRRPLVDFMTGHDWPFHVCREWDAAQVERVIDDGAYRNEDHDSYWVDHDEMGRIGVVRFEDLSDDAPLFDIRLGGQFRGRGLGSQVVRALTDHVFTTMTRVMRLEAQTREDNVAMRRVLLHCGFVKEAHYRDGWPVAGGAPMASVAYAILRRDWESGETTPVVWDDLSL